LRAVDARQQRKRRLARSVKSSYDGKESDLLIATLCDKLYTTTLRRAAPVLRPPERPRAPNLYCGASTLSAIIPDSNRWYIPAPVEAAAVRRGPGDGDLARIEALDADRMHDSLVFLAGYAPGVLDVILTATEPCLDDERPADADALEPFCTRCGAAAGIFISRGNEWLHYTGRPETADVQPYSTDHKPVVGWRIATSPIAEVAPNPSRCLPGAGR
jgi:hypothetical protein